MDNSEQSYNIFLPDIAHTIYLASSIAQFVYKENKQDSIKINLKGEIGTGKTTFARSFLQCCGVKERIKSPSYTILESYKLIRKNAYHFDFYRINDPMDFLDLGLKELLLEEAIFLIEWPEKVYPFLPEPDLEIIFQCYKDGRTAAIKAQTEQAVRWAKTKKMKQIFQSQLLDIDSLKR